MKKTFFLLSLLLLVVSCSEIPHEERRLFCEEHGMVAHTEIDGGWLCKMTDLSYVMQQQVDCISQEEITVKERTYVICLLEDCEDEETC